MNMKAEPQQPATKRVEHATRAFPRHAAAYTATGDERALDGMRRELTILEQAQAAGSLWAGWAPEGRRTWRFPGREDWLRARRVLTTIGGSDVGPVLFNAFEGEWGVFAPEYRKPGAWTGQGLRWERFILELYFDREGAPTPASPSLDAPYTICLGPEPWAHVSPDMQAIDPELGKGGVDAKLIFLNRDRDDLPSWRGVSKAWGTGELILVEERGALKDLPLPPAYDGQARLHMWCLDCGWWDITALMPGHELRVYRILRDLDAEAAMLEALYGWWETHIAEGKPPEFDPASDTCALWMTARLNARADKAREATDEEMALMRAYRQARDIEKTGKAAKNAARNTLLKAFKASGHNTFTFGDRLAATWNGRSLRVPNL